MTALPPILLRYQRQRAVNGPWHLQGTLNGPYEACIVIPALAEAVSLPETLESLSRSQQGVLARTLIVVVVNQRADADAASGRDNQKTLEFLQHYSKDKLQLAWVDACSLDRELPARQGVGLARKIGFDLCLPELKWQGNPFLVSLDADTLVHPDYLAALFKHFPQTQMGGAVIPFRHKQASEPSQERAIRHYELYLRSYAFGLHLAGSPFAYTSIGSAFACTAAAYIQAGGMNRRQAGEDFYFLQQLAKTSGVAEVHGALVIPSPRHSTRVPFGTGRAVSAQTEEGLTPFTFCDRSAFSILQGWLSLVTTQWQAKSSDLLRRAGSIDSRLMSFLERLNFSDVWSQLQNNHRHQEQFLNNFNCWFDGLRTRQLLTSLVRIESGSHLELINELFHWGGLAERGSQCEQLMELEQLQGVTPLLSDSALT